jgi:hypothetical protein
MACFGLTLKKPFLCQNGRFDISRERAENEVDAGELLENIVIISIFKKSRTSLKMAKK